MTRHIRLPLGSTTTETHCGDCYYQTAPGYCDVFGNTDADDVDDLRHRLCRAAEVKDKPSPPRYLCRTCGVSEVLIAGWECSGCSLY